MGHLRPLPWRCPTTNPHGLWLSSSRQALAALTRLNSVRCACEEDAGEAGSHGGLPGTADRYGFGRAAALPCAHNTYSGAPIRNAFRSGLNVSITPLPGFHVKGSNAHNTIYGAATTATRKFLCSLTWSSNTFSDDFLNSLQFTHHQQRPKAMRAGRDS